MIELDLGAIEAPLPAEARMEAYYYAFDRTGIGVVDAILSAVAVAGKGAQHTEDWLDEDDFGYYHGWSGLPDGESAADLIQATADRSAYQVKVLINEVRRLRELLKERANND